MRKLIILKKKSKEIKRGKNSFKYIKFKYKRYHKKYSFKNLLNDIPKYQNILKILLL